MREYTMRGLRAMENPLADGQMGVNPILTDLVLGQPQVLTFPGQRILRPITAPARLFQYEKWGNERLKAFDTERALRADIKHGDFQVTQETSFLKRFSFGVLKDVDELGNAAPNYEMASKSAAFARTIVEMDIERRRRDLLIATSSYASGHVTTLTGGSEWDSAGGDSKSNIRDAAKLICAKTGLQMEQLSVFLTYGALEAAKEDPLFLASRMNFDASTPTVSALQEYWGIGPVWSANPIEADGDSDTDIVAMYGDVAIIYYPGGAAGYDKTWGDLTFGVDFKWNKGVASTPFYLPQKTSWFYPWTDYSNPAIINVNAAALIKNTSSVV
jgi:hypothetical protein